MIEGGRRIFPVSLYATLFAALCCIAAPQVPRRVQGWLQGIQCLPLRAFATVTGGIPDRDPGISERAEQWARSLGRRLQGAALAGTDRIVPPDLEPIVCRVVERGGTGGAALPSTLWLDRSYDDVRDCLGFVTFGDRLLGFTAPPDAESSDREPSGVRVELLHGTVEGRPPRRVVAVAALEEGEMRFVIEPAGRIDEWPLSCRLLEKPYLASQLHRSGHEVRTADLRLDPLGPVPAKLRIGELRAWGYPGVEGGPLIGLFVKPDLDPREISVVVLWRPRRGGAPPLLPAVAAGERRPVQRLRVPAPPPATERWVLTSRSRAQVRVGAAVVSGITIVGMVEYGGPGFGLAAPFLRSRRPWCLVLLPDEVGLAPMQLRARGVGVAGERRVRLEVLGEPRSLVPGQLFTGANGLDCPLGLWVGQVVPHGADSRELIATLPRVDKGVAIWGGERGGAP